MGRVVSYMVANNKSYLRAINCYSYAKFDVALALRVLT